MPLDVSPALPPAPWRVTASGESVTVAAGTATIVITANRPEVARVVGLVVAAAPEVLSGAVGLVSALAELHARDLEAQGEELPPHFEIFLDDELADLDDGDAAAEISKAQQGLVAAIVKAASGPDDGDDDEPRPDR